MLNIQLLYDAAADYGHNYQYCYYDYSSFPLLLSLSYALSQKRSLSFTFICGQTEHLHK